MPALSPGWWRGWRGPKPLTADFRDRGRGFNVLSVGFNVLSVIGRCAAAAARGSLAVADAHRALRDPRLFVDVCHLTREGIAILASVFEDAVDADVASLKARR